MLIVLYLVLMLTVGRCKDELKFTTVHVGADVTMTCDRGGTGTIFWIRVISGNFPKVIGKTYDSENDRRFIAWEKPKLFVLTIKSAQLSDTAVYCCVQIHQRELVFVNAIDLRVKEPDRDTTAAPANDPVPPKDSASLHCSVLSDTEDKPCPNEKCVCCLRIGPHESARCFNYTHHGCSAYEGDEKLSTEKCFCSFMRNFSSSDAWTYRCAEDARGDALPGNGLKLNYEENCLEKNSALISLLCAALTVSLLLIVCLVVSIRNLKKKTHAALQTNAAASGFQENQQQTDEDALIYSAPAFTRNVAKAETRDAKLAESESIYSSIIYHNQNTAGSSTGN